MGSNQYLAGRVYDLCVYFMTETPEGSTESGLIEKPGIKPATPGLQDIGLSPTPRLQFPKYIDAMPLTLCIPSAHTMKNHLGMLFPNFLD